MTEPLRPPPRRNPLAKTREPMPLPGARSRAALGLAVGAAEGAFALQVCRDCETVQYPPRDVCGACLSARLRWRPVPETGRLLATTTARVTADRYFREHVPWRTGLVQLDCGPRIVAHLHGDCAPEGPVRLALKLDRAGRGAVFAFPPEATPDAEDDPQLREMTAPPKFRRALITDARASTAEALARALAGAGAARVFVGLSETWKPLPSRSRLEAVPGIEVVPLDLTDARSVGDLAGQIGDKVDLLVNNVAHVRPGGLVGGQDPVVARETHEICCLGTLRLAQAFGPVMRARAADGTRSAAAIATIMSAWALAAPPGWSAYGAAQAALRALSQALRQEMRPAGIRVVDILTGPLDDEWHGTLPSPKVRPAAVASALVVALRDGREEVIVGDVAKEIHAKWAEDPRLLRQETV